MALRVGVQTALFQLGRVPEWHQTDNSTAATHRPTEGKKRPFNDEYQAVMDHFGMKPRTIEVGESNQNGDVEALNGAFKRRLVPSTCSSVAAATSRASSPTRRGCSRSRPRRTRCE